MELITNEEILEIQKQFDSVIKKSQNFYPHTDELFENWKKNKSNFSAQYNMRYAPIMTGNKPKKIN